MIGLMSAGGSQQVARASRILLEIAVAVFLLLPAGRVGRAGDETSRIPGRITFSDGRILTGEIRTTSGKPLTLIETGTGRRLPLRLSDIYEMRVRVTHEEQYKVWRWQEDGSRQKVYTGETYPLRRLETEIELRNGEVHRGALVAVLYLYPKDDPSGKPKKVILRREMKGDVGTPLKSLVFAVSVEFPGAKPAGKEEVKPGISLTVTPPGALVAAHALPRTRQEEVDAGKTKTPGRVTFPDLLPDVYDLIVVTPDRIFLSLAAGPDAGKPVDAATQKAIQARVSEIPDFFEKRTVLMAVREKDQVRALVYKVRTGKTSLEGGHTFRRWEIWTLVKPADRWLVRGRCYVWREHGAELPPPRKAVLNGDLAAVKVETGTTEVHFRIPGEEGR